MLRIHGLHIGILCVYCYSKYVIRNLKYSNIKICMQKEETFSGRKNEKLCCFLSKEVIKIKSRIASVECLAPPWDMNPRERDSRDS